MENRSLHETITYVVETSDFEPLFAYLADDVVFKVTIPEGTPISGEFRGKQAVIEYFDRIGEIAEFHQEQPLELLTTENRIVLLGDDSFTIKKTGGTARSEYAIVFDLRDGLITRFLIIQDLSAFVDAYRSGSPPPAPGPGPAARGGDQ
jgi:ketosteroid isomerase-like protein